MFTKTKYVVLKEYNKMIVFSELIEHKQFAGLNPISAGFISFRANELGDVEAHCYGKSISLGISSRPDEDSEIANKQILGNI